MRTKTLILTVALSAAGIATSLAQVYSVNAVGYVNQTIPNNFSMIANPFVTPVNTLNALLPPSELPGGGPGVSFYKFVNGNYRVSAIDTVLGQGWLDGDGNPNGDIETIDFGQGGFILNQTGAPFTKTWVGDVAQSNPPGTPVTNPIDLGFSIRSSKIPQSGSIQSALGFPATAGDEIYKFIPERPIGVSFQNYEVYNNSEFGPGGGGTAADWQLDGNPVEPSLGIAESVFVNKVDTKSWDRVFSVN